MYKKTKAGFKLLQMKIAQSVNNTKKMKKENTRGGRQGQESGSMDPDGVGYMVAPQQILRTREPRSYPRAPLVQLFHRQMRKLGDVTCPRYLSKPVAGLARNSGVLPDALSSRPLGIPLCWLIEWP